MVISGIFATGASASYKTSDQFLSLSSTSVVATLPLPHKSTGWASKASVKPSKKRCPQKTKAKDEGEMDCVVLNLLSNSAPKFAVVVLPAVQDASLGVPYSMAHVPFPSEQMRVAEEKRLLWDPTKVVKD
jgi:hypothetical protein